MASVDLLKHPEHSLMIAEIVRPVRRAVSVRPGKSHRPHLLIGTIERSTAQIHAVDSSPELVGSLDDAQVW